MLDKTAYLIVMMNHNLGQITNFKVQLQNELGEFGPSIQSYPTIGGIFALIFVGTTTCSGFCIHRVVKRRNAKKVRQNVIDPLLAEEEGEGEEIVVVRLGWS